MTVKELIERLNEYPEYMNLPVTFDSEELFSGPHIQYLDETDFDRATNVDLG